MARPAAFVLPKGVEIELTGDTLSVKHAGDITIEHALGRSLDHVETNGDLTVRLPRITGTLVAGGTLTLEGAIDAVSIKAARVVLSASSISVKAISATESIRIGAAKMQVDAIIAPLIEIDPAASGRVTVIDSSNERASTKIKGGFSLADYEDMIGNAAKFLTDRGIEWPDVDASEPEPKPAVLTPDLTATMDDEVVLAPSPSAHDDDDEDVDDPLSLSLEDLEPLTDSEADSAAAIQARLQDALRRITACYDGGSDTPPAVSELTSLVEGGDVGALSQNITSVWNGLLGFHQQRGIRPHHQVTHAFNVIHSLVS